MQTYFLLGRYTSDSLDEANADRTSQLVGIIEDLNGFIKSIHALLGEYDLAVIVQLPGNVEAMRASLEIVRETGIQISTLPAISVKRFDELLDPPPESGRAPEFKLPPGMTPDVDISELN